MLWAAGCKDKASSAKPAVKPVAARPQGNPFARDRAAIAAGKKIYMQYGCSGCHGVGGGGGMGKPIIDDQWKFGSDDTTLFRLIRGDIPGQTMPNAIGRTLTDEQVWQVLAFVRTLYKGDPALVSWTPPPGEGDPGETVPAAAAVAPAGPEASDGQGLFIAQCSPCHGKGGRGDGPAAAALNPRPRDLTDSAYMSRLDDAYLLQLITRGGAAMGKSPLMPAQAALGEQQIRNVIAYVRTLPSAP